MKKLWIMLQALRIYFVYRKDSEKKYAAFMELCRKNDEIAVNALCKAQDKVMNGRKKVVIWWLYQKVYRCSNGNYCIAPMDAEER